ncbi:MAG: hypothetical protein QF448_06880 [Candidatus Thalassarchaeaceae archaeon]|nr:hypothetical protein [Candidatus Thalassarchaeaceae archaeon]
MADERWRARRDKLFDGIIEQSEDESIDQFIGRMRELETGTDPHHDERRTLIEEITFDLSMPTLGHDFRDTQDATLWKMRHSIGLEPTIRRIMSGRNGH